MIAERICWWQVPQRSASFGRNDVVNGATGTTPGLPCMLWQLLHDTSFLACLPDSQNTRWRLPAWQVWQTASLCAAGVPFLNGFAGLFDGSLRCSVASPWQFWHMLPL